MPCGKDVSANLTVTPDDKVIYAVEFMLEKNIKYVTVVINGRFISMSRLEDALKALVLNIT